jgi:hypothetical protein
MLRRIESSSPSVGLDFSVFLMVWRRAVLQSLLMPYGRMRYSVGEPLAYIIRKALATLSTFDEAVAFFAQVPLACDCLLLVTGAHQGELAIVERTSNRYAVRRPDAGLLLLTNHYCVIRSGFSAVGYVETGHEPSGRGSRERYCKSMERLSRQVPGTIESCLSVLAESPFLQGSTIWRSALKASSGQFLVAQPPISSPWHSPT